MWGGWKWQEQVWVWISGHVENSSGVSNYTDVWGRDIERWCGLKQSRVKAGPTDELLEILRYSRGHTDVTVFEFEVTKDVWETDCTVKKKVSSAKNTHPKALTYHLHNFAVKSVTFNHFQILGARYWVGWSLPGWTFDGVQEDSHQICPMWLAGHQEAVCLDCSPCCQCLHSVAG